MHESYSFQDVITSTTWDAALFTTYALSLSFFEAVPLIGLRGKGCRSIRILADVDGYRASVSEAGASQVGRSYEVTPVRVQGGHVFHPKISVVIGKDGARAMIGSGNMTFMGWGGNLEFMDYLCPEDAPAAFGDLALMLGALPETRRLHSGWPDLDQIIDGCWKASGRASEGRVRLLHNLSEPLADQVAAMTDVIGGATALRIVAPYWNRADAVLELAQLLKVEDVAVGVHAWAAERFPFEAIEQHGLKVRAVTGDLLPADARRLHGKLLVVEGRRGDLVLTGSANGSQAALTRTYNVEAGVLRVLDTAHRIGWRTVDRPPAQEATPEEVEQVPGVLVVLARFDGKAVIGNILADIATEDAWSGKLSDGRPDREIAVTVQVARDGRFQLRDAAAIDFLWQSRNAVLLRLRAGGRDAAGWVMQEAMLEAVREHGAVAESVIRLIGGSEDDADLESVLLFFAQSPDALLAGLARPTDASEAKAEKPLGTVDPDRLAMMADADIVRRGAGWLGGGRTAFAQLLQQLRGHIAYLPERPNDVEDENEIEGGEDDEAPSRAPPSPRLGNAFSLALDALEDQVRADEYREVKRDGLLLFLELVLFVTARMEEGFELCSHFLQRWRRLVAECSRFSDLPDGLELAYAQAVVARSQGNESDVGLHAILQRRWGRLLEADDWRRIAVVAAESRIAQRLAPDLDADGWRDRLGWIAAQRTPWMDAREIWECVQWGHAASEGNHLLAEPEGKTLREMIRGERDKRGLWAARDACHCPKNSIRLAQTEIARLATKRIARTNCCSIIILNLDP